MYCKGRFALLQCTCAGTRTRATARHKRKAKATVLYDKPLWTELDQQGRSVKWLAKTTGITLQRLYDLRHRGGWWRHDEADAVRRALGLPTKRLFPTGALVLPPGRRYPSTRGLIPRPPQPPPQRTTERDT